MEKKGTIERKGIGDNRLLRNCTIEEGKLMEYGSDRSMVLVQKLADESIRELRFLFSFGISTN